VLCSYNDCVKNSRDDIVILLNNDIKAAPGFIDPLVETIQKDPDVFMATPKALDGNGRMSGSITKAYIKWGIFWSGAAYPDFEKDIDKENVTFSAGIAAFDRKKFIDLGGYDEIYLPGTVEDSDICFRAWKRGWSCVYQPKSVIYHIGQASFGRAFGKKGISVINSRNVFLFMWKNISDKRMIAEHIIFLPWRLIHSLLSGRTELCAGFFLAMGKLGRALKRRRSPSTNVKRSDREIFDLFKV
jgi:GT2 family glycosyltransferase